MYNFLLQLLFSKKVICKSTSFKTNKCKEQNSIEGGENNPYTSAEVVQCH